MTGGDTSLSAATEAVAAVEVEDTAAELITCAVPLRVMAPAPTSPEEAPTVGKDAPRTLCRSSRNAGRADEHTLLKAERLAKKKNLEGNYFYTFLDSRIISNLGRLAINTNTSGVTRLKNLEVDRFVVCANKNNNVNANDLLSDDERGERLQEDLNHAGGFLNESLFDVESDHILDLSPVSRKKNLIKPRHKRLAIFPRSQKPLQRLL
jgi:hypothetical protein